MNKHYDAYLCRMVCRKMDPRPLQCSASMLGLNDYNYDDCKSIELIVENHNKKVDLLRNKYSELKKQRDWEENEAFKLGQKDNRK